MNLVKLLPFQAAGVVQMHDVVPLEQALDDLDALRMRDIVGVLVADQLMERAFRGRLAVQPVEHAPVVLEDEDFGEPGDADGGDPRQDGLVRHVRVADRYDDLVRQFGAVRIGFQQIRNQDHVLVGAWDDEGEFHRMRTGSGRGACRAERTTGRRPSTGIRPAARVAPPFARTSSHSAWGLAGHCKESGGAACHGPRSGAHARFATQLSVALAGPSGHTMARHRLHR